VIRRWIGLLVAQVIVRVVARTFVLLLLLAGAVAAAPVTVVAGGAFAVAWWRGLLPRRLLIAAAWCGPMVAVWLGLTASRSADPVSAATAPFHVWTVFWHLVRTGAVVRAAGTVAPVAIPLGLVAGAAAWFYRIRSLAAGAGGLSPAAAAAFDQRQWRHQARAARARIAAPGALPLTRRGDLILVGGVIRAVGHRAGTVAAIGYQRMRSHQVVIGTTGTGKTTLLLRLWAGFMATGLRRQAAGLGPPPLLVVLDCKGGSDARRIADRFRRVMREAGARSTAVWPDEASLSLWTLPPRQLTTTLVDLIETGTGSAAYYTDVMEALIGLAVEAPCGPPVSSHDLLTRLEPGWLSAAYAGAGTPGDHAMIKSAARHLSEVALRFRTLFRRLGAGLDGQGAFSDADAWYCILEGTDQISVAEGQARALVDLLASFAVRGPVRREILLAVDEFSAVSRRLPIWQLYERARSLGLAVQVSAQSWEGLGTSTDERRRIAASAEGGIWLLRTPEPEPVTSLAGTRKATETTRRLRRFPFWAPQGSSRLADVPVADASLIRGQDVGQVAYLYRGGVTYVQVKRLVASPAAVSPATVSAPDPGTPDDEAAEAKPDRRARAEGKAAATKATSSLLGAGQASRATRPAPPLADVSPLLDAAFGPEVAP
jgi:hypothetical protein